MGGTQITIEQQNTEAIPAALVASWIAGELTSFPAVVLTLEQQRIVIDIEAVAWDDRARLAEVLSLALEEPRFDGWLALLG